MLNRVLGQLRDFWAEVDFSLFHDVVDSAHLSPATSRALRDTIILP